MPRSNFSAEFKRNAVRRSPDVTIPRSKLPSGKRIQLCGAASASIAGAIHGICKQDFKFHENIDISCTLILVYILLILTIVMSSTLDFGG